MLFQSYEFAVFLLCVLALFFLVPGKARAVVLLVANGVFFCYAAPQAVIWLIISIVTTYICGCLLEKDYKTGVKRLILTCCVLLNLFILALFKYFPVWEDLLNASYGNGIRKIRLDAASDWSLTAPLGISFYTMQALGYLFDVMRKKYPAEKNLIYFASFVSFFPNLSSGPIERGDRFLPQIKRISSIKRRELFCYDRMATGLISILWGFFMKMVIADRAAILVDHLYSLYENTDSFTMLMAALFYSVQIFCDFASYSAIAVGAAQMMGFSLIQNFRQPYLAVGFKDFWNRWHISLSSWLRDYVYIPLGGNRKGVIRKELNIIMTFLVSGLWHGGAPQFLLWGVLHGACQVVEDLIRRLGNFVGQLLSVKKIPCFLLGIGWFIYAIFTFAVITLLWIFFRSDSVEMALVCLENLFTRWQGFLVADQLIFVMGLDKTEFLIAVGAVALLLLFEWISEWRKKSVSEWIYASPAVVRFMICLILLGSVFVFGKYGVGFDASNFIYMGF